MTCTICEQTRKSWENNYQSFYMKARVVKDDRGIDYISYEPKDECIWMFNDMQFNQFMNGAIGCKSVYKGSYNWIQDKEFPYDTERFYELIVCGTTYYLKIVSGQGWNTKPEDEFYPSSFTLMKDGIDVSVGKMYDFAQKLEDFMWTTHSLPDLKKRKTTEDRERTENLFWTPDSNPDDWKVGGEKHNLLVE